MVVALTVELPRAGQIKPSLAVLGYGLVKQCALGVARVVEFGFGRIWHEYCSNNSILRRLFERAKHKARTVASSGFVGLA